jgi:hypothetical protein
MTGFYTEPPGFAKTAISDLQGAWEHLRHTVVESWPFPECELLLFHIDEGMSWESVRDLDAMHKALLLVGNVAAQARTPESVLEAIDEVREMFTEAVDELGRGRG